MHFIANPFRNSDRSVEVAAGTPFPSDDWSRPTALLKRCPDAAVTPLARVDDFVGGAQIFLKDERRRMGLGSFKALGAAYVIACDAEDGTARGTTYVTASAGNHGLSVAAGAQAFGAHAMIYVADTVPESFADRLRSRGAEVRRAGSVYEESMAAAQTAAAANGWRLLSDSSWEGYYDIPHRLMEGYLTLMAETFTQMDAPPSHIFLQAGVGGLAAAGAAAARRHWGDAPVIVVVEPEAAPALMASVEAGRSVIAQGPVSCMGRLDCKEPSLIALRGLARDADWFCTITEAEAEGGVASLAEAGFETTPSGGAGVIAAMLADGAFGVTREARILCILSEDA